MNIKIQKFENAYVSEFSIGNDDACTCRITIPNFAKKIAKNFYEIPQLTKF